MPLTTIKATGKEKQ